MRRCKQFVVYILSSLSGVLYVGVTSDLRKRVWEHKNKIRPSFSGRYRIDRLVYYQERGGALEAIAREKELKKWSREKKVLLIERHNPIWEDLARNWYR
jgi:putative endonuclease